MSPDRERAMRDFSAFWESRVKALGITILAEEFTEELLRLNRASAATVKEVALRLGVKHLFCDPTSTERKELGINKDVHRREDFWLSCIEEHLEGEIILFVCGAQHLETFKSKLGEKGVQAEILPEQFGIGLPPPARESY